jgi:hypothetical protein
MSIKYKFSFISAGRGFNTHVMLGLLLATLLGGCKKFVQVSPPITGLTGNTVYSSNATAGSVLTGIYDNMMTGNGFSGGMSDIDVFAGLSADELQNFLNSYSSLQQYYQNALNPSTPLPWDEPYQYIYIANAALEGLTGSTEVTAPVKQQLFGEAKFMRAFMHFYLTNLYGDIPLVTTTNYQVNNVATRTPQAEVYDTIISDLKDAQNLLTDDYETATNSSTTERTRPNRGAATALLARAYLYTKDWKDAETQATTVINTATYALVAGLDSVFLANSSEAIWQLEPVSPGYNTNDAALFILTSGPNTITPMGISTFLLNAFEPNDKRYLDWVGVDSSTGTKYYFPYKYKVGYGQPVTEYRMVLRLAEQFLIRAEARAQQQNIIGPTGAIADLNVIRERAGLPDYAGATDQTSVLGVILHERQVELFTEWGHRWLDLKRTGAADTVMKAVTPAKGGTWNTDWELYPIPEYEISVNSRLTQNVGY